MKSWDWNRWQAALIAGGALAILYVVIISIARWLTSLAASQREFFLLVVVLVGGVLAVFITWHIYLRR
jgi:hypothetical protein